MQCIRKRDTICLYSIIFASERVKLYHTYNMFMIEILCSRKRETVSCLHYFYVLDFVYQKEGNYHSNDMFMFQTLCIRKRETIIPTICLCSRHCVSERGKLSFKRYVYVLDIVYQRETVSYLQCVYAIYWMYQKEENLSRMQYVNVLFYQKEGNCILPTSCLSSRFRVSERGNLHHTYSMFLFQIL